MTKFFRALALLALGTNIVSAQDPATAPGTLAYHLATNAAARATLPLDRAVFNGPNSVGLDHLTGAHWSPTFWLHGVHGLSATPIGYTNYPLSGQGLPTLVSPRHYLCATHMHPEAFTVAFLDTNNVVCFRRTLQKVDVGSDTSVGLLDNDVPASVEYLPVLPTDFMSYLPATSTNYVQGIGMNQAFYVFPQPMCFWSPGSVTWDPGMAVPHGVSTNGDVPIGGGDSSSPEMLLVGNQLVLASHIYSARGGPNYAYQIYAIDEKMHYLSTNNHCASDYQLTEFSLGNWPKIR
ncbi:MAG TPA: hypothetical protein VK742_18745 [Candidatus Sulfotelmatobacter sp.]|jgi:hypothetical protein|nr:hypothetical protein [Candidatus Sulfotelmatobacter sp.]